MNVAARMTLTLGISIAAAIMVGCGGGSETQGGEVGAGNRLDASSSLPNSNGGGGVANNSGGATNNAGGGVANNSAGSTGGSTTGNSGNSNTGTSGGQANSTGDGGKCTDNSQCSCANLTAGDNCCCDVASGMCVMMSMACSALAADAGAE